MLKYSKLFIYFVTDRHNKYVPDYGMHIEVTGMPLSTYYCMTVENWNMRKGEPYREVDQMCWMTTPQQKGKQ